MLIGYLDYKFFAFWILDLEEDFDQFILKGLIITLINSLKGKELICPSQFLLWKSITISVRQLVWSALMDFFTIAII